MNTKTLALTIVFTALAIALNPTLTKPTPAPFAPFLIYQLWEIPIVIAFLIISPKAGLGRISTKHSCSVRYYPGALPTGPIYNLAATLSMMVGIFATSCNR